MQHTPVMIDLFVEIMDNVQKTQMEYIRGIALYTDRENIAAFGKIQNIHKIIYTQMLALCMCLSC